MPSAGSSTRQRILSLVPCISSLAVFFFFLFFLLNMDGPATTSLLPYHMAFGVWACSLSRYGYPPDDHSSAFVLRRLQNKRRVTSS